MALDLTQVPTGALERLREAIVRERIAVPLSAFALRANGFAAVAEHADALAPLSRDALLVLLDAVLAERSSTPAAPELVWTGPDGRAGESRDTAVVVQELFARAKLHVTIAGFRFDHGKELLAGLHAAMRDRGVTCTIYADGPEAENLIATNWPFGPPFPDVYAFVAPQGMYASLHAKAVVIDHQTALVTSANFTNRGHARNIEVGVLLESPLLSQVLEGQLLASAAAGSFRRT